MTVLIAKNEKDKIILGADTGEFQGHHKKDMADKKESKIVTVNAIVFSSTGYVAEQSLFRLYCDSHSPESNTEMSILRFFYDFGRWKNDITKSSEPINNNYFFCYKGKLFWFNGGCVKQVPEGCFETDGCGCSEAYMAMRLTGGDVKKSISETIEMNCFVSGRVDIFEIDKDYY